MVVFEEEFMKSDGMPIQYKGKTIVMWDRLPLPAKSSVLEYKIISTSSEWKQGLSITTDGVIKFSNSEVIKKGWVAVFAEHHTIEEEFECHSKNKLLDIKNVWDSGDGCIDSWHNGAAMWVEEIPNGRRYHCNDGHPDDDFDDIVFEITIMKSI